MTTTPAGATDPHLQQCAGAQRDAQLQSVQAVAICDGPLAPNVRRLAHRAISRAWHIAQDAVEEEWLTILQQQKSSSAHGSHARHGATADGFACTGVLQASLQPSDSKGSSVPDLLCAVDDRKVLRIVVGHNQCWAAHALDLH